MACIERLLRGGHAAIGQRSGATGAMRMGFASFARQKYLNLETFKTNGQGVKTPVWFAADPSLRLDANDANRYVYTLGVAGNVKRLRNNLRVTVARCDMRGG